MNEFPIVGKEYEYLSNYVKVTRIVPLQGGDPGDAHVEFVTRLGEGGTCEAWSLREKPRRE